MLVTEQTPVITPSPTHEGISDSSFGRRETQLEEYITGHSIYIDGLETWLDEHSEQPVSSESILDNIRERDDAESRRADYESQKQNDLLRTREGLKALEPKYKQGFSAVIDEQVPEFFRGRYTSWVKKQGSLTRKVLGAIGAEVFGYYIPITSLHDKSVKAKQGDDESKPNWADYLANETDDAELVNFIQWYTHRLEVMARDPKIQAEIKAQKEEYKKGLIEGIDFGYIHPEARALVPAIDKTAILLGDYLDTYAKEQGGYADQYSHKAVIAEGDRRNNVLTVNNIKRSSKHEINHAELGQLGDLWLVEALTEHVNLVFTNGQWEIVEPKSRQDRGTYAAFRSLLAAIIESGSEPVRIAYWTRAYSAQTINARQQTRAELDAKLEEAYGVKDLLLLMDRLLESFANGIAKDHPEIRRPDFQAAKELADGWRKPAIRHQIIDELKYIQGPAQVAA